MEWTMALAIWGALTVASQAISIIKNAASLVSYLSRLFQKIKKPISTSFDNAALSGQRKKLAFA